MVVKDLVRYYGIKSPIKDFELFQQLCREIGSILNLRRLALDIGYAEETAAKHLDIFELTGLCLRLQKFETRKRLNLRTRGKIYAAAPSVALSVLGIDHLKDSRFVGHVIENYAFQRLRARCQTLNFTRDSQDREIDFIDPEHKIAMECKHGNFRTKELDYFRSASEKLNYRRLLLTKDSWGDKDTPALPVMLL